MQWKNLQIQKNVPELIQNTNLGPAKGFGNCLMPIMVISDYKNGEWGPLELLPYANWEFDPSSKGLHYGQQIFEGMKSYWIEQENPTLFRWEENWKRFNVSATRMAMPTISKEYFIESVTGMVHHVRPFIPRVSGQFLYIRPFMIATEKHMGIAPSQEFRYGVIASATESYLTGETQVLIERQYIRATKGGTGFAKTGGNYARGMFGSIEAKNLGFQQVLWLDAEDRDSVEEMSGMNFFVISNNNELITPKLKETILDGTTRSTILKIAQEIGLEAREVTISIAKLIEDIKSKKITQAFACGTASTIAPIKALGERNGTLYPFAQFPGELTVKIRSHLLDIYEGRKKSDPTWIYEVL